MLNRTGYGRRAYITDAARNKTDWVLTDASLDLDFANDRYYDGELAVLTDILSVSRSGTATYRDSSGIIQSATANTARIDHGFGLLIEETRTNLLLHSGDFSNASWSKSNATVSNAASDSNPDGTTGAKILISTTDNNFHAANQAASISAGATITASCFYKKTASDSIIQHEVSNGGVNGARVNVNLNTGALGTPAAIGAGSSINATIEAFPDGWYRVSLSCVLDGSSTTARLGCFLANNDINYGTYESYTGSGEGGVYVWGAQLEAGAFATSYIPTSGSSVTRNEDNAQIGTLGSWYNATEGGVYAEVDTTNWASGNNRIYMIQGSTSNRMEMKNNGGSGIKYETRVGNSRVVEEYPGTPSGIAKTAMRYKDDDYAIVLDGGTVETDTNAAVPGVSVINLGTYNNASDHLNGHMKRLALFDTTPDNATLQTLTS